MPPTLLIFLIYTLQWYKSYIESIKGSTPYDYSIPQELYTTPHQFFASTISDLWVETDRLFTAWNGSPMRPDSISEWFGKFIKMNNLPHITFHGLRHTNVSLLIADGVDIRTIATRLGHTNPTTTLNVYSHMLRKSDQLAADSLEKRILAIQTEVVKDEE